MMMFVAMFMVVAVIVMMMVVLVVRVFHARGDSDFGCGLRIEPSPEQQHQQRAA
jgi:hypothetical protein